jgi:hypothetical protein
MVDLDLRARTEVLMPGRLSWSRETTPDCGEHHEADSTAEERACWSRVSRPDNVDLIGLKRARRAPMLA